MTHNPKKSQKTLPIYWNIPIPEDKDPKRFSTNERRAQLLLMILEKGDPNLIHKSRMAAYYGVNQSTVSRDIQMIARSLRDNTTLDEIQFQIDVTFRKLRIEALRRDDPALLLKVNQSWISWLFDTGTVERATSKHDLGGQLDINVRMWGDQNNMETPE